MRPDQAMVLAAGLGVRMRPLSDLRPKPALPVLNRPLIAHLLDHLAGHGVRRVVVNCHHLPDDLESAAVRWKPESMDLILSREPRILGTAGGLRKAAMHFEDKPLYMINADGVTDADLSAAAEAHARSRRLATMVVQEHDPASGYRPVTVHDLGDGTARLVGLAGRRWGKTPGVDRTFIGIHVLQPEVLEAIPARRACDINADIYPDLLDEDPDSVGTWSHGGWWFEAGSPRRYLELNLQMLSRSGRDAVVGPGFFIDDDARVQRCSIGSGARLERNVSISDSVLWRNVVVAPGTSLTRCVVTNDVELPAGASFEDSIISPGDEGGPATVAALDPS